MEKILEFKINEDYRDPISIESEKSIFRGRKNEVNRLRDLVGLRKSAAVLVSGVRGVGKTSFVREALRRSRVLDNKKFPIIDLTFANLSLENKEDSLRLRVLKTLIRGLYLNNEARSIGGKRLQELYEKTYYSELKDKGLLETSKEERIIKESKRSNESIYKLDLSPTLDILAKVVGSVGGLWVIIKVSASVLVGLAWWQLLIFEILGLLFVFVIMSKFEVKTVFSYAKELGESITSKLGLSRAAKYDLSADTLESELKQILEIMKTSGNKPVFMIDELDKLDEEPKDETKPLEDHNIYKVIRTFKNLFSLSGSIFIFITSEGFYDSLEKERETNPYSTFHTIFSDRIFLPPLYYQDIESIVEGFVDGEITEHEEGSFIKFSRYISWQAKNHIFDTHNLIEEFVEHDGSGSMIARVYQGDRSHKGNVPEDWQTASALQTFIAAIYDGNSYLADPRKNEMLYLTLRAVCDILYKKRRLEVVGRGFLGILDDQQKKSLGIKTLDDNTKEDFEGAIEDLLLRSERQGLILMTTEKRPVGEAPEGETPEEEIVEVYSISEQFNYPDLDVIKESNVVTEFENTFLFDLDALRGLRTRLKQAGLSTFDQFEKEFQDFSNISEPIKSENPSGRKRKSEVLSASARIQQIISALRNAAVADVIKNIVAEMSLNVHDANASPSGSPMQTEDPGLASFYQYVVANLKYEDEYVILSTGNSHLFVGFNLNQTVQDEYAKISITGRRSSKSCVMNIISSQGITNKPREWRSLYLKEDLSNIGSLKREIKSRI